MCKYVVDVKGEEVFVKSFGFRHSEVKRSVAENHVLLVELLNERMRVREPNRNCFYTKRNDYMKDDRSGGGYFW